MADVTCIVIGYLNLMDHTQNISGLIRKVILLLVSNTILTSKSLLYEVCLMH